MLMDQPVPGGVSYYVAPFSRLAVDVPEEMTLVRYTGWAFGRGRYTVGLEDVATGSYLVLDINTGEELGRLIQAVSGDSRSVGTLFDQIVASARKVYASTFRYDTYDTTGAVATAGSYAFLADADDASTAVTTYEGLRDGTATALLIHTSDADGVSRAGVYDGVAAGDLFEWRQADDCFVRYTVTEVRPDPAGAAPRKLLAVEWMTYAFTGCSGVIPASTVATVDWGELPDLGGTSLTAPVIHGVYQIVPENWEGATKGRLLVYPPEFSDEKEADSLTEAQSLDLWREPTVLPEGWTFGWAGSGGYGSHAYGYCATFLTEARQYRGSSHVYEGVQICGYHAGSRFNRWDAEWNEGAQIRETRVLAGRPALVLYSPPGPNFDGLTAADVYIYDPATETEYAVLGKDTVLLDDVNTVIAIAVSLFEDDRAEEETPPDADTTTLRYDTYDTTGAVSTAGSYAFLASADTATATDSHDHLTDAAVLVVNVSDRFGASHETFYNSIEVGDVVEWYPVGYEDCWMRYKITELLPDPPGSPPRKRFAVEWLYVAFSLCVDYVLAEDELEVELRWNPPPARQMSDGGPATMLYDQPVPGGTSYKIAPHSPVLIDVPAELTIVRFTGFAFSSARQVVGLRDIESGSLLHLDQNTGEEISRDLKTSAGDSRDVGALFDQIVSSVRIAGSE